jgi:hypothetical protein
MATKNPQDGAKAFERFLPETTKITRVTPLRADPALALRNVARGVETVMRHEIRIRRELPRADVKALRALPDLARAVVFAAAEVQRSGPRKDDLRPLLSRARELRARLLSSAESLAAAGLVPSAEVAKIRAGLGVLDSARDCVALAALFRDHAAAVKGKSPVTRAAIDEADKVGAELVARLKPAAAKPAARAQLPAPTAASRDKLWTLLVRRHDALWRVGAYLFGRDVDRHVPALQAEGAKRKAAAGAS